MNKVFAIAGAIALSIIPTTSFSSPLFISQSTRPDEIRDLNECPQDTPYKHILSDGTIWCSWRRQTPTKEEEVTEKQLELMKNWLKNNQ